MSSPHLRLALCLALLIPAAASAEQRQEPVQISADQGRFEQDRGRGHYRGNVEMIQGDRTLYADEVELIMRDGELRRVEAIGTPVRMKEADFLESHADKLEYDLSRRTVILIGNAYIRHQGNTFEGARVEYNMDTRQVDASGEGEQRVRLVIPAESQNRGGSSNQQ